MGSDRNHPPRHNRNFRYRRDRLYYRQSKPGRANLDDPIRQCSDRSEQMFFYLKVLKKYALRYELPYPKNPKWARRLPTILTPEEMTRLPPPCCF